MGVRLAYHARNLPKFGGWWLGHLPFGGRQSIVHYVTPPPPGNTPPRPPPTHLRTHPPTPGASNLQLVRGEGGEHRIITEPPWWSKRGQEKASPVLVWPLHLLLCSASDLFLRVPFLSCLLLVLVWYQGLLIIGYVLLEAMPWWGAPWGGRSSLWSVNHLVWFMFDCIIMVTGCAPRPILHPSVALRGLTPLHLALCRCSSGGNQRSRGVQCVCG